VLSCAFPFGSTAGSTERESAVLHTHSARPRLRCRLDYMTLSMLVARPALSADSEVRVLPGAHAP
jgi:hypothetical protein